MTHDQEILDDWKEFNQLRFLDMDPDGNVLECPTKILVDFFIRAGVLRSDFLGLFIDQDNLMYAETYDEMYDY